ncbi:hypothetical protein O181_053713 [Austropuccinia psidii MF-1]|uniref:Uncharacterized protein n=1 Tax=Austropuccinia psidii MF-1 TaxID=1389203 RepID=A0A9Q3HQP1_9BASI|nr:hypothetical protein [Austropuccinia psidii MF-1]
MSHLPQKATVSHKRLRTVEDHLENWQEPTPEPNECLSPFTTPTLPPSKGTAGSASSGTSTRQQDFKSSANPNLDSPLEYASHSVGSRSAKLSSIATSQSLQPCNLNLNVGDLDRANNEESGSTQSLSDSFSKKNSRKKLKQCKTIDKTNPRLPSKQQESVLDSKEGQGLLQIPNTSLPIIVSGWGSSHEVHVPQSLELQRPTYENFILKLTELFRALFGKEPELNPDSGNKFTEKWKDLSSWREMNGISKKMYMYPSIRNYDTHFAHYTITNTRIDYSLKRAVEYHSIILAGSSIIEDLKLAAQEQALLSGLWVKWQLQGNALMATKHHTIEYPNYRRAIEHIDYSNKAVLTWISRLNELYSEPPFKEAELYETQKKTFRFLSELWQNFDLHDVRNNVHGELVRDLLKISHRKQTKSRAYTVYSWKIFEHFCKVEFNLERGNLSLKTALDYIIFQEALYHAHFINNVEIFPEFEFKLRKVQNSF